MRTRVEIGVADIKFLGQREERKNVRRYVKRRAKRVVMRGLGG